MKKDILNILNKLETIFEKEDYNRIHNIITYIKSYGFERYSDTEKISLDILYMLEDGIKKGKSVDEIIGDNDKEFVDEIFKNIKKKRYFINPQIFFLVIVLPLIDVLILFFENGIVWDDRLSFFKLFTFLILSVFMYKYEYLSKQSVYDEKNKFKVLIFFFVLIVLTAIFMRYLENKIGFKISAIYYILFSVVAFIFRFILNKFQRN